MSANDERAVENRAGHTLVEVVVAIGLVAMLAAGLFSSGIMVRKMTHANRVSLEARTLGIQLIEELSGGDVHAMLFAENNFVDNNLDTSGQPYLSVFGNMTAGNHVAINRDGQNRTRLDVTLDERIISLLDLPPGLPQALSGERSINVGGSWEIVAGSWNTHSPIVDNYTQQGNGY